MIAMTPQPAKEFIDQHGLRLRAVHRGLHVESEPGYPQWEFDQWDCTLSSRLHDRKMYVTFKCGVGHKGERPSLASILETVALDSADLPGIPFETWAEDCGFDTDSRRAEKVYLACLDQARRLRDFLGEDAARQLTERWVEFE